MPEKEINKKEARELLEFIEKKWDDLTCNARHGAKEIGDNPDRALYLPNDYIVPGRGKFNAMFYWDSYFIIQGLKTEESRQKLIRGIVDNCLYEVETYGRVLNANKAKWATRSQMPYLTGMIEIVYDIYPDKKWLGKAFETAQKEYNDYWLDSYHLTEAGLSRFYDESGADSIHSHTYKSRAEASWDMSPRFDDEDVHDLAPVDLNCNLYQYEKNFEEFASELGDERAAAEWRKKAESRKKIINELMWDTDDGLFYDYNFQTTQKKKIKSLAAYQAMFAGLADKNQAEKLRNNLKLFETKNGLASCDKDYGYGDRQWSYPIIWAPLQYIVAKGLERYGYAKEAERIKKDFIKLVSKNWKEGGEIWEKYNGKTGNLKVPFDRYPNQSGFGWTNAVVEVFIKEIYEV